MAALRPQASAFDRRPGPAPFFTRSSEAANGNRHERRRRVKREGLHDLRAPAESLSLNVDDRRAGRLRSPKRAECVDGRASVGTQTESGGRKGPAGSGDSEPSADDISDMFRFLDEMSACDSPGVAASSCYDSAGSLGSDSGESWAERGAVRPGRRQPDRLLRSLDGELKAGVGQLLARMGRIESELESLSAVRGEMAQVLGKLNEMDREMRRPDTADGGARQRDAPGSSSWQRSRGGRPAAFCRHALTSADAERGPGPKKAAARSPEMDDADVGTRDAAPGRRRTSARWCRGKHAVRREETTGRDAGGQASGREHRDTFAPAPRPPKAAATHAEERHLRAPPDAAGSPLDSNLRHSCNAERDLHRAGDGATGVQAESVSADELAFWLEDVHTPGYDSLLRRREAEFRRAKMCKLAALMAGTLAVILVIVVPICAMRP